MAPAPTQPAHPGSEAPENESPPSAGVGSFAVCPLCSSDLFEKRSELGALTQQGRRVESNLYHGSCITLMLAHNGAMIKGHIEAEHGASTSCEDFVISWGLSPVSRNAVDGFLKMPFISEQDQFIKFIDWRERGKVQADDLAAVIGALLPIDENGCPDFVRRTFRVDDDDSVSHGELTSHVLPFLQARCPDMAVDSPAQAKASSAFAKAVDALKMLTGVSHTYALRAASKTSQHVATCLLIYDLCLRLHRSGNQSFSVQRWRECDVITKAICSLSSGKSTVACTFVADLLRLDDDELSRRIVESLPQLTPREPSLMFAELVSNLESSAARTRLLVVNALAEWSKPGNKQAMQRFAALASDHDCRISTAAMRALGTLAEKGDQAAIAVVVTKLASSSLVVRSCAETTLPLVALGDEATIDRFCDDLGHSDCDVRTRAIRALGHIARRGDAKVVGELSVFLRSQPSNPKACSEQDRADKSVSACKASAILALGKVAIRGDTKVMKAIASALDEAISNIDCRVAEACIRAFARLTEPGNKWAIRVLNGVFDKSVLCPFGRALKMLVLEVFAEIGEGGDSRIFKSAVALLNDCDLEVRTQAVRTAGKTYKFGDEHGVDQVARLTKGCGDALVRREAEHAMQRIAEVRRNPNMQEGRAGCACVLQ